MVHLRFWRRLRLRLAAVFASILLAALAEGLAAEVGVARVDVTPREPIRLTGYGSRTTNSIGVEQRLWAKGLAIGSDAEGPALLLTLDNCGIAEETYRELGRRLGRFGVKQDHLVIACSHTHTGPATTHWAPNIFSRDIPPDQQATIDRYTRELIDKLEEAGRSALEDRRPAKLSWSQGTVAFARNRRVVVGDAARFGDNAGGPVDHSLPVLKVEDTEGKIRALVANYACHCTTLGGEFNRVCGDWAGYAQQYLERDNPGAVAFITIGCGADANPSPRGGADGGLALGQQHGEELAAEVKRLLSRTFVPLKGQLHARAKEIALPFGPHFSREQWEERAQTSGIVGYHARKNLARLDRGETLSTELYYPIVCWNFGDDLALVFLPGEVVVDYALRLKEEFDPKRLWITAYANYVPCYIPSRRILAEGGYEAEDSLWYYDRPARLSTNAEERIVKTVHELMPRPFWFDKQKAEFPNPRAPEHALATFRTKAEFTVELVASEPLVESPVAIDWDARGRLWVCEMYDYPSGVPDALAHANKRTTHGRRLGNPPPQASDYQPGGRIKVLTDRDGDGRYDTATLFLDGLPFPTGVIPWRKGALICAAPDILYAEDTDGNGRADLVRTNFTGFATHNYQARVNGFTWGLDGWLYGSSGLFGGKVKSLRTGQTVDLSGRDFRIKPETGEVEPVAGISQMGRVRDDFDHWFGNDNSTLLWHYPFPDHYARRNPYVTYPDPRVNVSTIAADGGRRSAQDSNQLFPISRTLERFNDPNMANRVTSACGPCIYRDDLLGPDYYGNAFICEPVHNLVTRLVLEPDGVTFAARRAPDEQQSEFLASTDNWFRPVQVRTGPDGALWIVDMYRFVIEHPRWIPTNRLAQLDVRAGADLGRIYRVYPRAATPRPTPDLAKLSDTRLVAVMNSANGPLRDLVHRELLSRFESSKRNGHRVDSGWASALAALDDLKRTGRSPAAQVQAACVGKTLREAPSLTIWRNAPTDVAPALRCQAVSDLELSFAQSGATERTRLDSSRGSRDPDPAGPALTLDVLVNRLAADPNVAVRYQLAFSLGQWADPCAGQALAQLARTANPWIRAAVLSSALPHFSALLRAARDWPTETPGRSEFIAQLCRVASGSGDLTNILRALEAIAPVSAARKDIGWYEPLAALLDAMERRSIALEPILATSRVADQVRQAFASARTDAVNPSADDAVREQSIRLLGGAGSGDADDISLLCRLLLPPTNARLQTAALARLRRRPDPGIAAMLLAQWTQYSPALRPRILRLMLDREDWTRQLLAGLKGGEVAPSEISPADRQQLLRHNSMEIRQSAVTVFQSGGSRTEALTRYQTVPALTGVPERGAGVFDRNCAQCHAFRGHGHAVGPNLAEFAGKSAHDFLVAILDPNSAINPNFLAYEVETKDGRSLIGIVKGETASSLALAQGGGVEEKILRSDIEEIRASQLSLMPEGFEQAMTPLEMADLIAWVKKSAPVPFGSASAEQATKARAEFLRGGGKGLARVLACAEQLPYPSWLGRLPMPYCRQNEGQNHLAWESFAPHDVGPEGVRSSDRAESEVARDGASGETPSTRSGFVTFRLPAAMGFASQPPGKFTLSVNGRSALDFDVTLTDQSWQSADDTVRLAYTVTENNSEDSNGILRIEVATSRLERGQAVQFEVTGSPSRSQRWFGLYLLP